VLVRIPEPHQKTRIETIGKMQYTLCDLLFIQLCAHTSTSAVGKFFSEATSGHHCFLATAMRYPIFPVTIDGTSSFQAHICSTILAR
jgi:hypothetical protein